MKRSVYISTMKLLVVIFLSMFTLTLASKRDGRIYGGENTTIDKHPWIVNLIYDGHHHCGGAILAASLAVTAAHCLESKPKPSSLLFRAGSIYNSEGGQLVAISSYEIHPAYESMGATHDLAVVRTASPFVLNENVTTINLPARDWDPVEGSNVIVAGWGRTEESSSSEHLLEVTVVTVSRANCRESWGAIQMVDETMVCAVLPGKDACNGDSGGPLTQGTVLVGLVSWGSSTCSNNMPGVYARVSHPAMWDWIQEKLKE